MKLYICPKCLVVFNIEKPLSRKGLKDYGQKTFPFCIDCFYSNDYFKYKYIIEDHYKVNNKERHDKEKHDAEEKEWKRQEDEDYIAKYYIKKIEKTDRKNYGIYLPEMYFSSYSIRELGLQVVENENFDLCFKTIRS